MADGAKSDPYEQSALNQLMLTLGFGVTAGLFALAFAQFPAIDPSGGVMAGTGVGVLIFLTAFAVGAFLGFLFGVPRAISRGDNGPTDEPLPSAPGIISETKPEAKRRVRLLQSNTNLEKASDWLTTLLLGAGLAELHDVNAALLQFRLFLAESATVFVDAHGHRSAGLLPVIGPAILLFGVATGFLFMYLRTRLVLVRMFAQIEKLLNDDDRLSATDARAVKAVAAEENPNSDSFVQRVLSSKPATTVDDALSLMFDLLYRDAPLRVIEIGAQLSSSSATKRPDYWFYLSAAFGQLMHKAAKDSVEYNSARDNALDTAARAVALNSGYRQRLWNISDPRGPENDLALLRGEPRFLRLVGRGE